MMSSETNPFSQEVTDAALEHAKEMFPQEACGLVLSGKYVPSENRAEHPEADFSIAKEEVAAAYKSGKLEGVWHSHTQGQNAPSKRDMESQIAMGLPWGIHVLEQGEEGPNFLNTLTLGDHLLDEPLEGRVWFSGVSDCVSVVRSYFKQKHGLILPDFPRDVSWWDGSGASPIDEVFPVYAEKFDILPPETPIRKEDIVTMAIRSSQSNHLGVMVEDQVILHHPMTGLSALRPFITLQATLTHVLRMKQ